MTTRPLRIAFFGTPEFAVPTFESLLDGPHRVVCAISQPDRGRGRGRAKTPSPVSAVAVRAGVPLLRPERVGEAEVVEAIGAREPDLGVVVAFGQFLPLRLRRAPRLGYLINAHASLLPRHRGAAPIAHAILAGDARTGVSVMRVEREMDAGPVALVRAVEIGADETAGELSARLAAVAAEAIAEALARIAEGRVTWTPQDDDAATLAPKIERGDARLDWSEPAGRLVRRVRAMAPTPGAFTTLDGEPLRILAARALPADADARECDPGTVVTAPDGGLQIATGDGWLRPLRLQRAGARELETDAFLRGRPIPDGTRFV